MSQSNSITFNSVDLKNVIPEANVLNINLGAIQMSMSSQDRLAGAGSIFGYRRDGIRKVTVEVELPLNKDNAGSNFSLLRAWADSDQPAPMLFGSGHVLYCILSSMSELSVKEYYKALDLEFTAFDPYFYGAARQADVGATAFTVNGDVETGFEIELLITSALSNPSWSIDNGAYSISLFGSIGTGDLVISSSDKGGKVTLAGQPIMDKVSYSSRFPLLKPGSHEITSSAGGVVKWIERWR